MMKNPKYTNPKNNVILIESEEGIFIACEPQGAYADLYEKAKRGDFGPVSPYILVPEPTEEEIYKSLAAKIRFQRNNLLLPTDWTQLPDVPEKTRELWAEYRQLLRDIPQQETFPYSVVFPEPPKR